MKSYIAYLATDNYLEAILILNKNLQLLNSKYPLLTLCSANLKNDTYFKLKQNNIKYKIISNEINNLNDYAHKEHPRWKYTINKIQIFNLTEYEKCIYLDCDMLILENLDYLFDYKEDFITGSYFCCLINGIAPQSNILIYTPNEQLYQGILSLMLNNPLSAGDEYYIYRYLAQNNYKLTLLPLSYNQTFNLIEVTDIKICHFPGEDKPWLNKNYFQEYNFPKNIQTIYTYLLNQINL